MRFIINASSLIIATLGRALGFPDTPSGLPSSTVTSLLESTQSIHAKPNSIHIPSMMLDAQKGQPIEVEVIIGEVVRMAKSVGVKIPVCIYIVHLTLLLLDAICLRTEWIYSAWKRSMLFYSLFKTKYCVN